MNTIYRVVWNAATGQWTVASELAHGKKKSGQRTMLAVAVATLLHPVGAMAQSVPSGALPTGGEVIGGQAIIGQSGSAMSIDQSTQRAAINWQTFDIGQDASVTFNQPNAQAQTLNRVIGGVPSSIEGALSANGQVLIQNANGVLFGNGASVNVGSLLATTKNVDPGQFMAEVRLP
ncbi:filamentous hemagglutinin N-terminal domain-containing protein [Lysobacter sp.]|uniref:two-partner secretion domain-containing protein n=1 Tax=Lysobacter sp. TaxID=72226 RepID=UPI002D33EFDE|nr:filamentous hemagglutinin N-terminal domain-containing protein [Lysobacter sp.]HZX77380.1 filamentous hemagglutinin N-terminal domain-containing protein [Lysobacter sp.]